jgi:hypothetical protein
MFSCQEGESRTLTHIRSPRSLEIGHDFAHLHPALTGPVRIPVVSIQCAASRDTGWTRRLCAVTIRGYGA